MLAKPLSKNKRRMGTPKALTRFSKVLNTLTLVSLGKKKHMARVNRSPFSTT